MPYNFILCFLVFIWNGRISLWNNFWDKEWLKQKVFYIVNSELNIIEKYSFQRPSW